MKTLNLRTVNEFLSRDQMRTIMGGTEQYGCKGSCKACVVNSDCCVGVCAGDQPLCGGGKRCLR